MLLREWVGEFYRSFGVLQAMNDIAAITRHDRYQASAGIRSAAEEVAELAVDAGLSDVEVLQFPADGTERWWTFQAPAAWTPRRAEVVFVDASGTASNCLLRYPDQPYSLAANSMATAADGITAHLVSWVERPRLSSLAGAVVLLDGQGPPTGHILNTLSRYGARGVICVSRVGGSAGGSSQVGRIELPAGSPLFAFSVTPMQLGELVLWAQAGGRIWVRVDTLTTGTMPIVTARIAGAVDDEALLTAHLCHAMPGANDNASGVAALLGVGRTLTGIGSGRPARTLRFLWGPEFVGLAAYLNKIVGAGRAPAPFAAVNLDMVGEDQHACGGPLIIERSPDHLPSWLSAVVEECVRTLPQASRSYSGAVPCDTWAWRSTPFAGASDHSLLVDRSVGCPSVQLGHWPDRFNHSSDDTLDKVDPDELRRAACAAGAAVAAICYAGPEDAGELERVTLSWASAYLLDCLAVPLTAPRPGWIDPLDPDLAADRLAHRTEVGVGAIRALGELHPLRSGRHRARADWLRGLSMHLRDLIPSPVGSSDGEVLVPDWPGPFNLRGLIFQAQPADRAWVTGLLEADRGGMYATMLAVAHALDGQTDRVGVLRRAAFSSGLAIGADVGMRYLEVLVSSGWARRTES